MLKVMTLVGTRPELIKMSRVIAELDKHVDHILVHSGQNFDYELNQVFFDELDIRKPDHFLNAVGESTAETIGSIIVKADQIFELEKPDALLLYGDTNTCLAVIAAKRRKIPVFHMEAGNRCFDQRVPEELNRKVLDHLSDVNMVLTEHARRYLISEGIKPELIFKTGSHMQQVLSHYMPKIVKSDALKRLGIQKKEYFIVSTHREENVDSPENLHDLLDTLNGLAREYKMPIIVSTHPRTKKRLDNLRDVFVDPLIKFIKPFGFLDYINLQMNAYCILSDSGTITEEASLLSLPAVMIRNAHERPEGMDDGVIIMCGLKLESVLRAVQITAEQNADSQQSSVKVDDYEGGDVAKKVVKLVLSYVDYINKNIWKK